ncbi:universal stress protein [Magnetospirillum sp. SS-4]|uniref:universal stress protein n=1 Tax=Magnetospirillum sp. SS-4 TaxID=2681465 RepID=UPI001571756F|nr:universal stress protein [Magnetospirillum sp. SS-4]
MTFKDILVHVDDSARAAIRLDVAIALAAEHQAHLVALNVRPQGPRTAAIGAPFGNELEAAMARNDAEAAGRTRAMVESRPVPDGLAVEWRDVIGDPVDEVALHARYCDVAVIGQTEPDAPGGRPLADNLVLAVGRPLLVIPHSGRFSAIGRRVLLAWNGSREATRAVHDSMPVLARAAVVHVIAVNPGHGQDGHGDVPGADICLHLSRHGVNAVCEQIRTDDLDVGEMLLNRAADEDCDLIVMGGYGRSRLREMVLGGATRHLLEHMTVPVMLSH